MCAEILYNDGKNRITFDDSVKKSFEITKVINRPDTIEYMLTRADNMVFEFSIQISKIKIHHVTAVRYIYEPSISSLPMIGFYGKYGRCILSIEELCNDITVFVSNDNQYCLDIDITELREYNCGI